VTVNVAANAPSSVTNEVSVAGGGSAAANASDPTTILPLPALTITEAHTGNFTQGENGAIYTVTVSNGAGSVPASQTVTVTEIVPSFLNLVSMAGSGWTCPANGNTCTRTDSLAAGMSYPSITVTVNVAGNAAPSVINQVNAAYGGWTSPNASDPTTVVAACALTRGGSASVADIQKVINEALGLTQAADDLNQDGLVNAVDVQIVINATLGLGCSL
jgi:uncharacterized repeat protein (TIGR01451 family)